MHEIIDRLAVSWNAVIIDRKATDGSWYPQDLNDGKLENYFFFLAAVMFLNFLVFVFLARRYKYVESLKTRTSVTVEEVKQHNEA